MKVKTFSNQELDQRIKSLAQKERELLHEILWVIKEIDSRKLYLDLGFPSLFAYLKEGVGYSEGSAQRRIDAARLLKDLPEIADQIKRGEINLNQISLVQRASREIFKRENRKISTSDKQTLLASLGGKNHFESQSQVAKFFDLPLQHQEKKSVQSDNSIRVEMTFTEDQYAQLQRAQELISHSLSTKDLAEFVVYIAKKIIQQKQKGLPTVKQDQFDTATVAVNESSINSNSLKHNSCQYVDVKTGRKCNSRWHLQTDHIVPKWSLDYQSSINAQNLNQAENLRSLCAAHNRMKYLKENHRRWV